MYTVVHRIGASTIAWSDLAFFFDFRDARFTRSRFNIFEPKTQKKKKYFCVRAYSNAHRVFENSKFTLILKIKIWF